jgi:hypothetical protein
MFALLYPFGRWFGLPGLPLASVAGAACAVPLLGRAVRRCTDCTLSDIVAVLAPPVAAAGAMVLAFGALRPGGLIPALAGAAVAYLAAIGLFEWIWPRYSPLLDLLVVLKIAIRRRANWEVNQISGV